jgi:hypothetical protein
MDMHTARCSKLRGSFSLTVVKTIGCQTIQNAKGILKSFIARNNLRSDTSRGVADVPETVNLTGLHDIFSPRMKIHLNAFRRFKPK